MSTPLEIRFDKLRQQMLELHGDYAEVIRSAVEEKVTVICNALPKDAIKAAVEAEREACANAAEEWLRSNDGADDDGLPHYIRNREA